MKVLFHAINGVGLGHVIRLAWISRAIRGSGHVHSCPVVSTSAHASRYFEGPVEIVPCDLTSPREHGRRVVAAVARTRPDVMVFDCRWPSGLPAVLETDHIRRVLILRAMLPEKMIRIATEAMNKFDSIILPHTLDELTFNYSSNPDLMRLLLGPPFAIVGPLARVHNKPSDNSGVLFSLVGGGEYLGSTAPSDTIEFQLRLFVRAARVLAHQGMSNLRFVAGPMLNGTLDLGPLNPIRSFETHTHMGPLVCVVSRGGYNTAWEAIGAGSHLVLNSSHRIAEDVQLRCSYLDERGLARYVDGTVEGLVAAIRAGPAPNLEVGRRSVNSGLADVTRAILK